MPKHNPQRGAGLCQQHFPASMSVLMTLHLRYLEGTGCL